MMTAYTLSGQVLGYTGRMAFPPLPTLYRHRPGLQYVASVECQGDMMQAIRLFTAQPMGHA